MQLISLKAKVLKHASIFSRYYAVALLIAFINTANVNGQPVESKLLERAVYKFNNNFNYDSSKITITSFLQTPGLSNENKFYGFLYLSYTYKRLFDYPSNLEYLDSALYYGQRTGNPEYYVNNVTCQKAYAFFDTHEYEKSDSLMKLLSQQQYKYLNEENQSKIFMQEAYLFYLQKAYKEAEDRYYLALGKMQLSSPCDKPMIYGKLIELYGAMRNNTRMHNAYQRAVQCADSCGIIKYNLYAVEMMALGYEQSGEYKQALFYTHLRDSLNEVYNAQTYRDKLLELEVKHKGELKEKQIALQQKTIQSKNLLIILLAAVLVVSCLAVMYYLLRQRQLKIQQNKNNIERYATQLLKKTEEDRKHIAGHLHDSLSHELLNLKNMVDIGNSDMRDRIDMLIEDVRHISHQLHPVVFSRVGIVHSIAHLVERVQEKNRFMITADVCYKKGLSSEADLQIYRIIQEAITNMVKHSKAVAGKITMKQYADSVLVEIKDNGQGFEVVKMLNSDKAFGLHNIIERSKAAGGNADIKSDKTGTIITIKIPIRKQ